MSSLSKTLKNESEVNKFELNIAETTTTSIDDSRNQMSVNKFEANINASTLSNTLTNESLISKFERNIQDQTIQQSMNATNSMTEQGSINKFEQNIDEKHASLTDLAAQSADGKIRSFTANVSEPITLGMLSTQASIANNNAPIDMSKLMNIMSRLDASTLKKMVPLNPNKEEATSKAGLGNSII